MSLSDVLAVTGPCTGFLVGVWWQRRAADRAYVLALDHVEQMTRPGKIDTCTLDEALTRLRSEGVRG